MCGYVGVNTLWGQKEPTIGNQQELKKNKVFEFLIKHPTSGWIYNMEDFDVNNNQRGTVLEGTQNIT